MNIKQSTLAAAVLSACGMGLSGNALAEAYAYSFNDIFYLSTVFTCGGVVGCGAFGGTDNFDFVSYQSSSSADANTIPNPAGGVTDGQTATATVSGGNIISFSQSYADAPVAFQTPDAVAAPTNNVYTAIGMSPAGGNDYARADAQIVSEQVRGDATTRSINVAEGLITDETGAIANGANSSTTGFTLGFVASTDWSVDISFDALPYITAFIGTGGAATGDLDVSFTIQRVNADGSTTTVFNWAPDGTVDANSGTGIASEIDDASMNLEIADTTVDGTSAVYNPMANDADCTAAGCDYQAISDVFAAGRYNLVYTMHEGIVLSQAARVPEPGILALMGLGLMGLGFARRTGRKA